LSRAPGDDRSIRPIVAIALVLCAVFRAMVPDRRHGTFYKQFAVTMRDLT